MLKVNNKRFSNPHPLDKDCNSRISSNSNNSNNTILSLLFAEMPHLPAKRSVPYWVLRKQSKQTLCWEASQRFFLIPSLYRHCASFTNEARVRVHQEDMRAEDWKYMGEGGKHAVFTLCNQQKRQGQWDLLRVSKEDLACSEVFCAQGKFTNVKTRASEPSSFHSYIQDVIAPCLPPYIDVFQTQRLEWEFLVELRKRSLETDDPSCKIPEKRLCSWFPEHYNNHPSQESLRRRQYAIGFLGPNYRQPLPVSPSVQDCSQNDDAMTFSVEIKPKAGYLACSPLVLPQRRIKYRTSRFQLLQRLYVQGKLTREWMDPKADCFTFSDMSRYDPLDLFSQETDRIHKAVNALMSCPQNCFRVWRGSTRTDRDESFMNTVLTTILKEEDFLPSLLELQRLDVLDGDGAIIAYERLRKLEGRERDQCSCRRSCLRERVEQSLDSVAPKLSLYICQENTSSAQHPLLVASPLGSSVCCNSRIHEFCEQTSKVRREIMLEDNEVSKAVTGTATSSTTSSLIDTLHRKAMHLVQSMEKEELEYLLQLWLLSLSMCDISFFIRLREVSESIAEAAAEHERRASVARGVSQSYSRYSDFRVDRRQSSENVGVLSFVELRDRIPTRRWFAYELKLIDCDQKPAKKLRTRHKKEALFDVFATSESEITVDGRCMGK